MHSQSAMPPADAASTLSMSCPRGCRRSRSAARTMPATLACWFTWAGCRTGGGSGAAGTSCGDPGAGVRGGHGGGEVADRDRGMGRRGTGRVLAAFGVRRDRRTGAWVVPSETTIRRTLGGRRGRAGCPGRRVAAGPAGYGADEDAAGTRW